MIYNFYKLIPDNEETNSKIIMLNCDIKDYELELVGYAEGGTLQLADKNDSLFIKYIEDSLEKIKMDRAELDLFESRLLKSALYNTI